MMSIVATSGVSFSFYSLCISMLNVYIQRYINLFILDLKNYRFIKNLYSVMLLTQISVPLGEYASILYKYGITSVSSPIFMMLALRNCEIILSQQYFPITQLTCFWFSHVDRLFSVRTINSFTVLKARMAEKLKALVR